MQVGDLVQFDYINGHTRDINRKVGMYMGERPLKRDDGMIINNFAVHMLGKTSETICDGGLKKWLKVIS